MTNRYIESFIRLFYPAECEICRKMLPLEENILCATCAEALLALAIPPEETFVDERFEFLDNIWTVFNYESPLKELLHGVKYARKEYLLKPCLTPSASLAQAVVSSQSYEALLPIPIDRLKFVQRHFNQSESLADMMASYLTRPITKSILVKRHPVPSQTFLGRTEREINVYGSFKVRNAQKVRGRSFLLIDDVFTTGSTANEAARVLKLQGAKRVDLLALARATPIKTV
ncbi:MAG TPA: phosphoribosyltransferase family protein [Candidatus Omnitrophota bacterium]|nr:phosphoribosyltransferase family protein [Candidatus Omnitrophota bacterium]HPS37385.1 phosphoribosyltransferase family protein [Candidatus Omnitrophota bacterium]